MGAAALSGAVTRTISIAVIVSGEFRCEVCRIVRSNIFYPIKNNHEHFVWYLYTYEYG